MGKIILRLDRVMADRKMSLNELSERVGVEQAAFENEIVGIFGSGQSAQEFFLEEQLQALLVTDAGGLRFIFQFCENGSSNICHYE